MKKIIMMLLCLTPLKISAAVVNQVILTIGDLAITSFDIQQMRDFQKESAQSTISANEALKMLINLSALQIIAENDPLYYMDEVEIRKAVNNITNNATDPASAQRKELYDKYSSIYRLFLRSEKAKRGLMVNNAQIRAIINEPISEKDASAFYNKNKKIFQDSPFPKFDLIIFAVESSTRWSLSELSQVEEDMAALARDLDNSNDFNALRRKYSKLRFTSYSGATGLFAPDILILQKKIPDEVLGISMQPQIQLNPQTTIKIQKNKGIYIPQPIPFRSTGEPTYLTFKILDIVQPRQLSLEEALPRVEEMIKFERAEKAISELIKERIKQGQFTLTSTSDSHQSVINEYSK